MPVDTLHADYLKRTEQWRIMRDVVEGQEAIHAAGILYLPKLLGHSDGEYASYVMRTPFYEATARTIDGLSGMIFRRDPEIRFPPDGRPWLDDITLSGISLIGLAEQAVEELLVVGRCGVFVDHQADPTADPDGGRVVPLTVAQARSQNRRPFLRLYKAEDIVNWSSGLRRGRTVLTRVVLRELVFEPYADTAANVPIPTTAPAARPRARGRATVSSAHPLRDEFDQVEREQYRVLDFDPDDGRYRVRLYRRFVQGNQVGWEVETSYPLMSDASPDDLPFVFMNPRDTSWEVVKPPLLGLAHINAAHYRTLADLKHGAHFTALPTPVITGHTLGEGQVLGLGSGEVWVFSEPTANAKFLEFTGQGLMSLERMLDREEEHMAFLGARMLAPDKRASEAVETARIHRQGEHSVLASLGISASYALQKALRVLSEWGGLSGEVVFRLNVDFDPTALSAQELAEIVKAWQQGAMPDRDLYHNLLRGEVLSPGQTFEQWQAEREAQAAPALPEGARMPQDGDEEEGEDEEEEEEEENAA